MENFDLRSKTYNNLNWVTEENYMEEIIDALNIQTGKEWILDIGPGTAPVAKELLRRWPDLHFVMVEPSSGMIEKISEFITENPNYYVTIYSDINFLEYPITVTTTIPYIFDRVLVRSVFHHFESPKQIYNTLETIMSYLNKKGKIIIGEDCPPTQVYDGCALYISKEDTKTFNDILSKKEERLSYEEIVFSIFEFAKLHDIIYISKYLESGERSVNNWLDNGSLLNHEQKEEIKNLYRNMNKDQKERFGVKEVGDDVMVNFRNIIIKI